MSNSKLFKNPEYEELQLNLNVYLMAQRYADEHECPNCGFKGGLVVSQSDCDKYECLNCGHRGSFDQEIVDRNDVESEWLSSYTEEEREEVYDNPHAVSVQEEEHMKKESMEVVGRIVKRERELFGIRVIKKDNTSKVRQMYPEAWHMFYLLENENNLVPPLEIQGTMEVLKNDQIRLLWFIHPIMINEWNMENCILFANEVNRELGNGGRFWVDTEYFDFAYEERFEEEMLQLSGMNVLERHMFEWPLGQFRDIHISLMMLLQGKWGAETAIRFIKELRENGFVENEKYDLFPDA